VCFISRLAGDFYVWCYFLNFLCSTKAAAGALWAVATALFVAMMWYVRKGCFVCGDDVGLAHGGERWVSVSKSIH
jgi:hypothetical protein